MGSNRLQRIKLLFMISSQWPIWITNNDFGTQISVITAYSKITSEVNEICTAITS